MDIFIQWHSVYKKLCNFIEKYSESKNLRINETYIFSLETFSKYWIKKNSSFC